ncbi:galactose mutarotase [Arthrobacter alpinus]|uniref:aldose-1-epimerase n=1 Tax=Arthrobacter alpinus TaxID=656366 RepID=UPI0005CB5022|nr:aldose-1-epimerase [Arthrobacter alpinus]ALV46238.1 galactose mutarotase [Arthrobacter alpinus]
MHSNSTRPVSGTQIALTSGDYQAVIASVGASLRSLTHRGRNLVVPFEAAEIRPGYRGANLAPWPNRIADGAYTFGGERHQLAVNEIDRLTALHGLVIWNEWELLDQSPHSATFGAVVEPQEGYPHRLAIEATYTLSEEGLAWRISATNIGVGTDPAPYGVGPHPYLVAGSGTVDGWTLELPASQVLSVTPERLLPTTLDDVRGDHGGYFDFRHGRELGSTKIDHAFTGLRTAAAGETSANEVEVRVTAPEGTGVLMRWNAAVLPWVQIHTADRPEPGLNRIGLAVEPMSCPPDAFNSGTDLISLSPGERHDAQWIIAAL